MNVVDMTDFIDHAIALAEAVEADIKHGETYSTGTVLALSKFVAISMPVLTAMAAFNKDKDTLQ
jgi:hypothetical protein